MTQQNNPFPEPSRWSVTSVSVKAVFIGVLIIVLLIPSVLIQNLVSERQERSEEVQKEISQTWSDSQTIKGPILCIPYTGIETFTDANKHQSTREVSHKLYLLPQTLDFDANVKSEKRQRGNFTASVYNAGVKVKASFHKPDLAALGVSNIRLLPEQAKLLFAISDAKGLQTLPVINNGPQQLKAEFTASTDNPFGPSFIANYNATALLQQDASFTFTLDLKGSNELHFLPLGNANTAKIKGNWPSPSFEGSIAADASHIDTNGFSANWHTLNVVRPLPQQWTDTDNQLTNEDIVSKSSFGVRMLVAVDDYQKTMRTSKYAILIIVLSFAALFLTEVIGKHSIHTFNYMLMGAAMIVYYTLLLSFSEQIGFNAAYAVASVATVGLITWFIASLLKNAKAAALFSFIISTLYIFIFVIIQLEDLALMVGSIALFIVVALLMYFSRKINWNNQ